MKGLVNHGKGMERGSDGGRVSMEATSHVERLGVEAEGVRVPLGLVGSGSRGVEAACLREVVRVAKAMLHGSSLLEDEMTREVER